jgi:hypothetical protein
MDNLLPIHLVVVKLRGAATSLSRKPSRTDVRGRSSDRDVLYYLGPDSHWGGTCDAGQYSNISWYKLETILHQETVKPWISHWYGSLRRRGLQLLTVKPCLGTITHKR